MPPERDLFGEIPITLGDVLAWMLAVPGIAPTSPRFAHYLRTYRVLEKIHAAKAAGTFDEIIGAAPAAPPYRLAAAIDVAELELKRWRRLRGL